MSEALQAYRHVAASDEFKEKERMWAKARHDEAQALYNAERKRDEHWQGVIAEVVAEKDAVLADKDSENADLRAQLEALRKQIGTI
ncbi:MAG: hypothetical protein FWC07_09835 [Defluviitaleaceae bacterium]|nr:hypothetical protein [Defluviitaleaceae bacterium]